MSTQSLLRCQERPHLNFPTKLFINNEFVNSSTGATLETVDPASGKGICHVAAGNEEDVAKAVDAAYAAFHNSWKFTDPSTRRSFLLSLADKVAANRQELINMEALDTGKPVAEAEFDIKDTEKMLRYFAGYADKIMSTSSPMDGNYSAVTLRQPVGVVGLIVAWNYPLSMAATKIAAALACGCTIVIKPAENTPLTTLRFAQFAYEVGLPAGVLNVISGYGTIAGAALAKSMKINMISFTGSTLVGKKIMEASAASNMKRVALECGGKSPLVIWKDANMELAVPIAADGIFAHAGQICTASSRLYIHEEIYDVFVEQLCSDARKRTCGDCYSGANLGPIISELQLKKVIEYIEIGKQEGARLLCGGNRVGTEGFFIEPTIFVDVDDNMRIAKEEIFGPVLCIFKFSTMKEVLARCNKSEYGLAAGIFTENIGVAQEFTSKVEAGIVWVNTYNIFDPAQDFGGWKMSGFGREGPLGSIEMFTEKKTVLYATTEKLVKL